VLLALSIASSTVKQAAKAPQSRSAWASVAREQPRDFRARHFFPFRRVSDAKAVEAFPACNQSLHCPLPLHAHANLSGIGAISRFPIVLRCLLRSAVVQRREPDCRSQAWAREEMMGRGGGARQAANATRDASRDVATTYDGGIVDPFPMYAQYRRSEPVIEGDILARYGVPSQADFANKGRKVFTVFRYRDVFDILRDHETWVNDILLDGLGAFVGELMLQAQDGQAHREIRSLIQPCFHPKAMAAWREKLAAVLETNFAQPLRARGSMELMEDLATPFPVWAIYSLFGFPDEPDLLDRFAGWALQLLSGPQADPDKAAITIPAARQAAENLYRNLLTIVADARAQGRGEGLIGLLLRPRRARWTTIVSPSWSE
jgi:hypothetical protein